MLIENEYKSLISEEMYKWLSTIINWTSEINQTNFYYLDEKKQILHNGNTLRIREIGNNKILQFKKYVENNGALHVREEYEFPMYSIPQNLDEDLIKNMFKEEYYNINLIGSLKTKRKVFLGENFTLCLDKNIFLKSVDYEIEIEIENDMNNELHNLIKPLLQNMFKRNTVGKFSRFYNRYMEIKNGCPQRD